MDLGIYNRLAVFKINLWFLNTAFINLVRIEGEAI